MDAAPPAKHDGPFGSARCLCPANARFDVPCWLGLNAKCLAVGEYLQLFQFPEGVSHIRDGAAASSGSLLDGVLTPFGEFLFDTWITEDIDLLSPSS